MKLMYGVICCHRGKFVMLNRSTIEVVAVILMLTFLWMASEVDERLIAMRADERIHVPECSSALTAFRKAFLETSDRFLIGLAQKWRRILLIAARSENMWATRAIKINEVAKS